MPKTVSEEILEEYVSNLSMMDDIFFTQVMDNNVELAQYFLDIIREFYKEIPELKIKSVTTEKIVEDTIKQTIGLEEDSEEKDEDDSEENSENKSGKKTTRQSKAGLTGHGVRFDLYIVAEGKIENEDGELVETEFIIDIEIQNYSEDGIALRVRYYFDMMDLNTLHSRTKYKTLPEQLIIFISTVNLFDNDYAFDYTKTFWVYSGKVYNDHRHLIIMTNNPKVHDPRFEIIVELVNNLAQSNPALITDKVIRDVYVKEKNDIMKNDKLSEKFLAPAREWIQTADPDGARRIAEARAEEKAKADVTINALQDELNKANKEKDAYADALRRFVPDFDFSSI